jgi:hypothetical protein
MICVLKGVAAFLACALVVGLFLPSIEDRHSYHPKTLPVKVRVIDTDEHKPIEGAEVTFFRGRDTSLDDPEPQLDGRQLLSSGITDASGYVEIMGTFRGSARRQGDLWNGLDPKYHLDQRWLKVKALDRPVSYIQIDRGERDYDDDRPLEVIVVLNKAPAE